MKPRLAEITAKYIGAPYRLGGWSREEGFDCVSLICAVGEELGVAMPKRFGGYRRDNYKSIWKKDRAKAKKLLLEFAASLGNEIQVSRAFAPDLLVLQAKGRDPILGIHAGNDLVLSAFTDLGVALANVRTYEIKAAYRWVIREDSY